jgi:hypothetical protein
VQRTPANSGKPRCPIDLNGDYPCPCRCRGRLTPIALMDAMGCMRCQQIFVLSPNADLIERVAPAYPGRQQWYWDGSQWLRLDRGLKDRFWPICLVFLGLLALVWLPWTTHSRGGFHSLLVAIVPIVMVALLAVLVWIAYRR